MTERSDSMQQISLHGTLDTEEILNLDRHLSDSPYQNLAYLLSNQEFSKELFSEILLIQFAEKLYYAKKLTTMDSDEKQEFFKITNEENLPDCRNIHVKQIYKSYAALCRFLGEPENLKGEQRKKQMKRFKRCFNWMVTGKGHEIIITQKFSRPKPEKKKGNGNVVYMKHIEYLLLSYLYKCENNVAEMSLTDMMIRFGMVKNSYQKVKSELYKVEDFDIVDSARKDFIQDTQNVSYQIIYRTLESLSDRRLITYRKVVTIDDEVADLEKIDIIRHTELELLKKYNLKKMSQVHMKPEIQRKFYAERNRILLFKYGWKYIRNKYQIKSNHEDILYGIQDIADEIRKELSYLFKERMLHEYKKKKAEYHKDVIDFSKLLDGEGTVTKEDDSIICYDILADIKSEDREKYLDKYLNMITCYLPQ